MNEKSTGGGVKHCRKKRKNKEERGQGRRKHLTLANAKVKGEGRGLGGKTQKSKKKENKKGNNKRGKINISHRTKLKTQETNLGKRVKESSRGKSKPYQTMRQKEADSKSGRCEEKRNEGKKKREGAKLK